MFTKFTGLVLGTLMMAGSASAATMSYTTAETNPEIRLTLDDAAMPGSLRFSLSAISGFADFLGLGFDYAGSRIAQDMIRLVGFDSTSNKPYTPALELFGDNTGAQSECGKGCNLKGNGGSGDTMFDYIVRIGQNGGGKNNVASVVFDIAGVDLVDFSNFAVRAQETSNGGSIKYGLNPDAPVPTPSPVPLPAAGFVLMAGLGALSVLRRRKPAAA